MGSLVRWRVSFALLRRAIRTSLLRCSDGRRESGIIIFLNGITQGCHQYHIRIHPWTMFFYGVIASSKPSVAPPKRAMIADALELLPLQMALSLDRTVFYATPTSPLAVVDSLLPKALASSAGVLACATYPSPCDT